MYLSIVVTLSRPEHIDLVFDNLVSVVKNDNHIYEVIIGIDNKKIDTFAIEERLWEMRSFKNISVFNTKHKPPRKVDMSQRRTRIAHLREETKNYIGGSDMVFSFEDDTALPKGALQMLLDDWNEVAKPGFIEGVQVGRWGYPYIGAWKVDDINNPTIYITIPDYNEVVGADYYAIQSIDAGGFYCYITSTKLYKEVNYGWQEPCGPDVDFGLKLRRMGYQNYIDWMVVCGHQDKDKILYPKHVVQLEFTKVNPTRWKNKVTKIIEANI